MERENVTKSQLKKVLIEIIHGYAIVPKIIFKYIEMKGWEGIYQYADGLSLWMMELKAIAIAFKFHLLNRTIFETPKFFTANDVMLGQCGQEGECVCGSASQQGA